MFSIDNPLVQQVNEIPIFDIMNVRGYNVIIDDRIRTFLYSEDIAREAGLIYERKDSRRTAPQLVEGHSVPLQYEEIRWQTFEKYMYEEFEHLKEFNPNLAPLVQLEMARSSYILYELALMILMRCNSKKAGHFRAVLSCFIVPQMQQFAYDLLHDKMIYQRLCKEDGKGRQVYETSPLEQTDYYDISYEAYFYIPDTDLVKDLGVSVYAFQEFCFKYGILEKRKYEPVVATPRFRNMVQPRYENRVLRTYWSLYGYSEITNKFRDLGFSLYEDNSKLMESMIK